MAAAAARWLSRGGATAARVNGGGPRCNLFPRVGQERLLVTGIASPVSAQRLRPPRSCSGVWRGLSGHGGAGGETKSAVRGPDPAQITHAMRQCTGAEGLLALVNEHGSSFNHIHVSAAWSTATRAQFGVPGSSGRARQELAQKLQALALANMAAMGAREVATVLHSAAKLHLLGWRPARELVEGLMLRATATADSLEPQGASILMWALAKMEQKPHAALLEAVQHQATATIRGFKPQGVSNLLWSLATMREQPQPFLLDAMQRQAVKTAPGFKAQEVKDVLWALATLEVAPEPELVSAMQRQAMATAGEWNPQIIANLTWALAKMDQTPDRALLEAMQKKAVATADRFNHGGVTMFMWALATMGETPHADLLTAMQRRATATASGSTPQGVSNLLWALAKMGEEPDADLLAAMQRRALVIAREFIPQEIVNLMWALATMGKTADADLLEAMQRRSTALVEEFIPKGVSNLMWALAKMGEQPHEDLLEGMQWRAHALAGDFKPQEIASFVWAVATMRAQLYEDVLDEMLPQALLVAGDFKPQEISSLMWALVTMGKRPHRDLLEAMQLRATALAGGFIPQGVSSLMWALASMGIKPDADLLEAMQKRAMALAGDFKPQEAANLLWAHACFGVSPDGAAPSFFESMAAGILADGFERLNVSERSQIHQFLLSCALEPAWKEHALPESVRRIQADHGEDLRLTFLQAAVHPSRLQRQVAKSLRTLFKGLDVSEEVHEARSGYSIDVRVERSWAGRGRGGEEAGSESEVVWAVEVDGPAHFVMCGNVHHPRGSNLLKRRHLELLGLSVVSVRYWEWNRFLGKPKKHLHYLQKKLHLYKGHWARGRLPGKHEQPDPSASSSHVNVPRDN